MSFVKKILFALIFINNIFGEDLPDTITRKIQNFSDSDKIKFLTDLSWSLREKNTDLALIYAKEAVRISDSLNISVYASKANNFLGVIYIHYKYDTENAIPYFHKGLEVALQTKDSIEIAYSYNNLGDVFYLTGNVPLALEYAKISLAYFEKLNDKKGIAYSYINLGLAQRINKNYKTALKCFQKAIEIRKEIGFDIGIASALLEIAITHFQNNNLVTALKYFEESLELHKEIDNSRYMAICLNGIGDVYYQQGKYPSALKMYDESIKYNTERNHDYGIVDNRLGKALVYSKIGNRSRGERELKTAINLANKLGLQPKILKAYETSAKFYMNLNDYKTAVSELNDFLFIYDSLFSQQQFETLTEIENRFLIDKKLKEAETSLRIKNTQQIYFIIIILLLAGLVSIYIWRHKATKKLNQKLAESNRSKDKLFSIISHDLRNPFSALMGYLEFLKEKNISESDRNKYIKELETTTQNTYDLLENLLNLSASRSGNLNYSPLLFDLSELMKSIEKSLITLLNKKSINLKTSIQIKNIYADKQMFEIILRNLLTNAVKFSNKGGVIEVTANVEQNYYKVAVSDNGVGMDRETIEKLFASEIVESDWGTEGEKGTGLGLSLCKEFIEKHNGKISVESEPGKGSTFYITIPIKADH